MRNRRPPSALVDHSPEGQLRLFAPSPRHNHTRTSREAARRAEPRQETAMARVLAAVRGLGAAGGTHERIAQASGICIDTVKARVHDLGQVGRVVALAELGTTSRGSSAMVFVAADFAGGRRLEDWPRKRTDWRAEAVAWRARAEAAEAELEELRRRLTPTQAGAV